MPSDTTPKSTQRWLASLLGTDFLLWSPNIQAPAFLNWEKIYATRRIKAGRPIPLEESPERDTTYKFNGTLRTLDDLMEADHLSGVLVLRNGKIAVERYALGLERHRTWQSSSMVKSVASTLIGAAIHDGFIKSLDELVTDHVPELKSNPAYEGVNLRHILQMCSGTLFTEDYSKIDQDVNANYLKPIAERVPGAILEQLKQAPRVAAPGTQFAYNTGDTFILSLVLSRAVGKSVAEYCSERIWKPMGMETDGYFLLESDDGDEVTGSCHGASLRDYGLFGQLMVNDGVATNGERILPEGWVAEATAMSAPNFNYVTWNVPGSDFQGYGYLWWIMRPGQFMALGVAGQWIYVIPEEGLVFVLIGALPNPPYVRPDEPMASNPGNYLGTLERMAFIDAIRERTAAARSQ